MSKRKLNPNPPTDLDRSTKRYRPDGRTPELERELIFDKMPSAVEGMVGIEMPTPPRGEESLDMNAEIAQEPALITGATTGDLTAEAAQHAQGPTDLPEETATIPVSKHWNDDGSTFQGGTTTVIHDENAGLGRQLNTCIDMIVLRVAGRMDSLEDALNRKINSLETQLQELSRRAPPPMDEDGGKFELLVKSHAEKMLYSHRGRTIVPPKLDVPEVAEVLNFLVDGHPGPTSGCLRIDPASGPNSRWNLRACEVFAQDFSAAQYPDADGKTLMDASHEFYRLIPTLSSRHAVASGFTDVQSYVKFQESFAKHIRRHQLTESRLRVVSGVECLKKFLPIIQRLAEEDGMSSDERDAGNDRRLYSTPPFWRDSSITDWLHSIDSIGSRSANSTKRVQVERLRTSEVDMGSQVVKGLPVNFYSKCYLDTLDEFQYLDLDPKSAASLELNDSVEC